MRRLPPVGAIQAFVQVARAGSLKAAAENLALSSSALTRRIQNLEHFVGTPLFSRVHNSVQLNGEGRSFLDEVAPHLDAIVQAVDQISSPSQPMRLQIAVPSLFAAQRLLPALAVLRRIHPALHVDVDSGANRIDRLDNGLDAAIAIAAAVDGRFYSRMIETGHVAAIASRDLRMEGEPLREPLDLARVPILLHRDMPNAFDHWRKRIGLPGLEPSAIYHFDAGQLVLDAAAEGLGVAFMLKGHLDHSTDHRLRQVFDATVESPYTYWFACSHGALRRRPVRIFHDWLFETFQPQS